MRKFIGLKNKQGCSVVILDYDKMNVSLTFETAKRISNRSEDFLSNRVTYCYVVKNKKFVKIGRDIFLQYPKDKIARNNAIFEVIKKAFD